MADKEEVQGEGHGLDEILHEAAAGVLRKAEDEKSALRARISELEGEAKFLRGQAEERRLEVRFVPRDKLAVGEGNVTGSRLESPDGAIRHIVAIQSPHSTPEILEELRKELPDNVLLVGLPPGMEMSVLEVVPRRGG